MNDDDDDDCDDDDTMYAGVVRAHRKPAADGDERPIARARVHGKP